MRDSDQDRAQNIAEAAAHAVGCSPEAVSGLKLLGGGASMENWLAVIARDGEDQRVVIRTEPENWRFADSENVPLSGEAALLRAAYAHGVAVPELLFELDEEHGITGYIMAHIDGETVGGRILKSEPLAKAREGLAYQCGQTLAAIHRVPRAELPPLESFSPIESVTRLRDHFRKFNQDRPVFELAFQWLEQHAPDDTERCLVHGDFRNGNLVVGEDGLRAVLDWETAHLGCSAEDFGWLCITSWRFQNPGLPVGGFGTREQLIQGYTDAGGREWTPDELRFWEILGTLRWGIICAQVVGQFDGDQGAVESAVIARRASETEFDLLRLIAAKEDAHVG